MPTDAESLTITSSKQDKNAAVGSCISQLKAENADMTQEQAVAICMAMSRKAMGHGDTKAV